MLLTLTLNKVSNQLFLDILSGINFMYYMYFRDVYKKTFTSEVHILNTLNCIERKLLLNFRLLDILKSHIT